jgi:hypothetical protein
MEVAGGTVEEPLEGEPASQFASQSGDDPDQRAGTEEMTEPVDPVRRLLPSPHPEPDREDRPTDVVCGVIGCGRERPSSEREEQRRVRELCDWKAARPAQLAAPPELGDGHRVIVAGCSLAAVR